MESPACPPRQLPDVYIVKPKLEPGEDSASSASDAAEDQETSPLSGDRPFFTAVMSRTQVQKPYQLGIPARFHRRLPARRAAAVLRCGGRSWIMGGLRRRQPAAGRRRVRVRAGGGGHRRKWCSRCRYSAAACRSREVASKSKGANADEPIVIVIGR